MKNLIICIFSLLIFSAKLEAQPEISVDTLFGCNELSVGFSITPPGVYDTISSLTWDFGDGETMEDVLLPRHKYDSAGAFSPSVLINESVSISMNKDIHVHISPNAYFYWSDSLEISPRAFMFNSAEQPTDTLNYTYTWNIEGLNLVNSGSFFHEFSSTGVFSVLLEVSHNYGCVDSVRQSVPVANLLDIPNVFTPNFDGRNDYFTVRTDGVNIYQLVVYARSGMLVFKSESPVIKWDGRNMSGAELKEGVYYYSIVQINGSPKTERSGFIQLIR